MNSSKVKRGAVVSFMFSPGGIYSGVWLTIIIFYIFNRYSPYILPFDNNTEFFLLSSVIVFAIPSLVWVRSSSYDVKQVSYNHDASVYVNNRVSLMFSCWFGLSLVEAVVTGNLPLLGVLGFGKYVYYMQFGISNMHGFVNAMALVVSNYCVYFYFFRTKHSISRWLCRIYFGVIVLWYIMIISRQMLMSIFIQGFFVYIIFMIRKHRFNFSDVKNLANIKKLVKANVRKLWHVILLVVLGSGIFLLLLFPLLGDIRSNQDVYAMAKIYDYPTFLPKNTVWVYLYITSPISNLIYNFKTVTPNYYGNNFLANAIPVGNLFKKDTWQLVTSFLTTSSIHQTFVLDFGWGALAIYTAFSLLFSKLYSYALNGTRPIYFAMIYVVVAHNLFFSPFDDLFSKTFLISQILIHIIIRVKLKL